MKRIVFICMVSFAGCDSGFQKIDKRVDDLMASNSASIGATSPTVAFSKKEQFEESVDNTAPTTINPPSSELVYVAASEKDAQSVAVSLELTEEFFEENSTVLPLNEALAWANNNAKEVEFAQYDYVSTTLSLLTELHVWGPQFSNTVSSGVDGDSTNGLYNTSVDVLNDFQVTQNLYNGGTVSASALTSFATSVHGVSTTDSESDTTVGVNIEIPLLSGSGAVARESLIQAKRNLVYGARTFERFRRTFYKDIVSDYLSLVVQKQSLQNAQMGVDSLQQLAKRQSALYESGRTRLYDAADAENQALAAAAALSQSWESFRLSLDRFKIRIGWPIDDHITVSPSELGVVPPAVSVSEAVLQALLYRLDLQNEFNRLGDSKRAVANAVNSLLPEVTLTAGVDTNSDANKPLSFSGEDIDFIAGLAFSLPLNKEDERIEVRQQQIALEKSKRRYRESRDTVAVEVRSALRRIEVYLFTLDLQERNVEIAQLGLDSINADPDRVSVLDQTRAISDLQSAKDSRDSAKRDLELSIVDYLLQAGQLRINEEGSLVLPQTEHSGN